MSKATIWIFICSALLAFKIFHDPLKPQKDNAPINASSWIQRRHHNLRAHFKDPELADYLLSVTVGEKRWLNPSTKALHKKFTLTHLFTPSGLHFGTLIMVLRLFIKSRWLLLPFYLAPFLFGGFYSCKRVGLILGSKNIFSNTSLYALMLIMMSLDYALGTYEYSPKSFLYSFTFLGVFISLIGSGKGRIFFTLIATHIVLAYFTGDPIAPLGIFMGLLLTPLFCLAFPLLFLSVFISALMPLSEWVLSLWFSLLQHLPTPETFFYASFPLLIATLCNRRLPVPIITLLLLIHSDPCHSSKRGRNYSFERLLPEKVVSQIVRKNYGYLVDSKAWGLRCRYTLAGDEWRAKCRDLPAWKKRQKLVAQ